MMADMQRELLYLLVLCAALPGCESGSPLPLDVEVKDSTGLAGSRWDEIQLIVKSLPGAEVRLADQTKSMEETRATEQFAVPKSQLKLGKNSFLVRAQKAALLTKRTAEKTVEWDATPKALLRFHGSSKGDAEALNCTSTICGDSTLRATKNGQLPLEVESAVPGVVSFGTSKVDVVPRQRAALDLDVLAIIAAHPVGELPQVSIPFSFEANGVKADGVLDLGGSGLSDLAARSFAQVEQSPLTFAGETAPTAPRRDLLLVVGAPANKFITVGTPGKFADVDLVGIAKKAERSVACSADTEILYNDLEIRVFDRRSAKTLGTKKLLADRVACPPTPAGKLTGEVREDDVKRVLAEFLTQ